MFSLPVNYPRVRRVNSFAELVTTPFADGVNALCWQRTLPGDFGEIVQHCATGEDIVFLEEDFLAKLSLSAAGRLAAEVMLADLRLLRERRLDPVLNCIHGYPRDDEPGPIATDVFSFHVDSAPVETDTYLCTYHGAPSEGLRNDQAERRVDITATRAEFLKCFGGADDDAFQEYLRDNCYDLHYAPAAGAQPFSFGVGNLWRIATEWPGSPVPPCVHRAPDSSRNQPPRLLLIS